MICPCSLSRFRWVRNFCALLCAILGCCSAPAAARAQGVDTEKPLQIIDEDITAFAFAPDGRIVYSVRRNFKTKLYDLQHDDIWLQEANGKRRRLLVGEKFKPGAVPVSYFVDSFRWSPSGHVILAELFATSVVEDTGKTQDSLMILALEDGGKQLRISGHEVIENGGDAIWLKDNATIVYMTEAVKPRALFSFQYTNLATGPAGAAFEGRTFAGASAIPGTDSAIAVERDRAQTGPPRLQRLELLAQEDKELATLQGYEGGLSVSPSGKKVAYYIDKEVLEIRDLTDVRRVARVRVGLGVFHWGPGETRILLKRAAERKTAELVWVDLPELLEHAAVLDRDIPVAQPEPQPILRAIGFRDFAISEDGGRVGVIAPGKHNLLVFSLSGEVEGQRSRP